MAIGIVIICMTYIWGWKIGGYGVYPSKPEETDMGRTER